MQFVVRSIGVVRSTRSELLDDHWDSETTVIELESDVPDDAIKELDKFSHAEVIFLADQASDVPPAAWVRRPRGNPEWPEVGIFAQRNKDRPNRLLVSVAQIAAVNGRTISLIGLDAVDGTPVLDIKPVFPWGAARGQLWAPQWVNELGEHYFS
jgi:tRNA (Thr-GGU) A37 N-methylase